MEDIFKCPRCGNSNPLYIGEIKGKKYCRYCISMNGKSAEPPNMKGGLVQLKLSYELSNEQKKISDKVLENYKNDKDTLINAVCGAGKTELVYQVIAYCLSTKRTVAFAVPRRDVVIELCCRIKEAFLSNQVTSVYGGHTDRLVGEIVVLTTHQLYRYENYFDLIVLDEIDAFPFKNNKLLEMMFKRAKRGNIVMMSATPSNEIIEYFSVQKRSILELNTRFHRHPLPVPKVIIKIGIAKIFWLINYLKKTISEKKKIFIFTPTISKCEQVYKLLRFAIKNGEYVHSKKGNRTEIIKKFKNGEFDYLVTTAVLERGVTFKNLQVVVIEADNAIYDEYALVQISGRVGRKFDAPDGDVIFLVNKLTPAIESSIRTIKKKNESL